VAGVVQAFSEAEDSIDSHVHPTTSDSALAVLRPALLALGFEVEAGKKKVEKLRRPVLFGEQGREDQAYEVDAFHAGDGPAQRPDTGEVREGRPVRLLTAQEVGERLQVPATWVYREARAGRLPCVVVGRYRRFDLADVERWIAEQKTTNGKARA
jgi:excisionase family DNA binding protein